MTARPARCRDDGYRQSWNFIRCWSARCTGAACRRRGATRSSPKTRCPTRATGA
ncbi:MAG: hypothetical protein MZW92_14185 [Comamonadaceae bacterium]|nr:hypothetical protein [Comamonadaceae bacterium]